MLINQGNGTFAAPGDYLAGSTPAAIAAADLNGDGHPELAVANYGSGDVSVLRNLGNGTFAASLNHAAGPTPYSIAAADMNGDGHPDLAVTNYSSNAVTVLLTTCLP